jgi:tetratricopeptide (TPR) repeat protein
VLLLALLASCLITVCVAQDGPPAEQVPTDKSAPPPEDNRAKPPRSDSPSSSSSESSSKQTEIDISTPAGDEAAHPEAGLGDNGAGEFTPYNPMKAMKDIEVGDYYYKRDNYRAAISRYREALEYKPQDAEATFKLAEALNKSGDAPDAAENYRAYLKILPNGPYAKKAKEALGKLKTAPSAQNPAPSAQNATPK